MRIISSVLLFVLFFCNTAIAQITYFPNNISFETGTAVLTKESIPELDKIYESLKSSESRIEIYGYQSNSGEKVKLERLSEDRAKAVYKYLLKKGLSPHRMNYRAYGGKKPAEAKNQQVGIRVLN
jgi:outer membrane protein OmpA-like peptidoglycan-associated protein